MLRADLDAPRKQRHTLTRIFHRLLDEYGAEEVSYAMVRDYVYDPRREILVEEAADLRPRSSRSPIARATGPRSISGTCGSTSAAP